MSEIGKTCVIRMTPDQVRILYEMLLDVPDADENDETCNEIREIIKEVVNDSYDNIFDSWMKERAKTDG